METPTSTRKTRSNKKSELKTPANTRAPPNMGKTPLITPKFDTNSLSRTVARVARKNEVLVSLSGSPVVGVTTQVSRMSRTITRVLSLSLNLFSVNFYP